MKTVIIGDRGCKSTEIFKEALRQAEEQGINISEVITGEEQGISKIAADWAKDHSINLVTFPVNWSDISAEGALIKERFNSWKKRKEPYNANAGKARDEKMLQYAEALISIDLGSGHSKWTAITAKKMGIPVYEYSPPRIEDDLEEFVF